MNTNGEGSLQVGGETFIIFKGYWLKQDSLACDQTHILVFRERQVGKKQGGPDDRTCWEALGRGGLPDVKKGKKHKNGERGLGYQKKSALPILKDWTQVKKL